MDTDTRTCKNLIENALEAAAAAVSDQLEVDHDTKRVLGSPNIVNVIAEKIEAASVVVTDVTLTGITEKSGGEKKYQINSNVATELGYALGAHTDRAARKDGAEVLIKVMNVHYADPSKLPFDVQQRHPLQYKLAPGATKPEWKQARDSLKNDLITVLTDYHKKWKSHPSRQPVPFEPIQPTIHEGAYWRSGDLLVNEMESFSSPEPTKLSFADNQSFIYLRLSPVEQLEPIKLTNLPMVKPFMVGSGSTSDARNQYGRIFYSTLDGKSLWGITQLFKSREIWGLVPYFFTEKDKDHLTISSEWLTDRFERSLEQYSNCAKDHLNFHKARVVAGLVNFGGRCTLSLPNHNWHGTTYLIHNDIKTESTIDLEQELEISLFRKKLIDDVYEEAGVEG